MRKRPSKLSPKFLNALFLTPIASCFAATFNITTINDSTSSTPQYLVSSGGNASIVYTVQNSSGGTLSAPFSFIPPQALPTTINTTYSSCYTTGGLASLATAGGTCSLYMTFTVPPYISGGTNTYPLGRVTACAGATNCSTTASANEVTVTVLPNYTIFTDDVARSNIDVFNSATFLRTTRITGFTFILGLAVSPSNNRLYITDAPASPVLDIYTTTSPYTLTAQVSSATGGWGSIIGNLGVTPDGSMILVMDNSSPGHIFFIGANSLSPVHSSLTLGSSPSNITILKNGQAAYVATQNSPNHGLSVVSLTGFTASFTGVSTSVFDVATTPDQTQVWMTSLGPQIYIYNTTTNSQNGMSQTLTNTTPEAWSVASSSLYNKMYVTDFSGSGGVHVFYVGNGQVINTGELIPVTGLELIRMAPNGNLAYIANTSSPFAINVLNTQYDYMVGSLSPNNTSLPNFIAITQ